MATHACCSRRSLLLAATIVLLAAGPPRTAGQVTGDQVKQAIRAGVRAIRSRQLADGTWPERYYPGGESCLATLALLQAGEPRDSRTVASALEHIRRLEDTHVYVTSLKIMALVQADPQRYRREIEASARWLAQAQNQTGLWHYTPDGQGFDHSNSQFALLGLHAAAQAGVKIPPTVWQRAQATVLRTQNDDGGWSYREKAESYGSMTAAGVSDLIILGHTPLARRERGYRDGAAPGCGKYKTDRPLVRGLEWLAHRFRADQNPGRGQSYVYYWLYGVERCGILSGQRFFGRREWYREGAQYLVRTQRPDGTWPGDLVDTCFAVLFLAKGHKALLLQKLQWSDDEAWNPDRHDVENLVSFIGDQLGEPVAWQAVPFDAPLEEWLAAPILYFQGHEFPKWDAAQRAKLRTYVEQGGTLLAEACCSRREFRHGFEQFVAATFPEVPLVELDPQHPIYRSQFDLKPAGLMGVDLGCRTSVIFIPRDVSCLWEQAETGPPGERAFQLGTNIAAYAVGRGGEGGLRDRLSVVTLPKEDPTAAGLPPKDALRLAQVVYHGDWRPDPQALVHLAEFLRDEVRLDVVTRYKPIRLTDGDLYASPVLYLTGHFEFRFSAEEIEALRGHLRRGGFLLAEACCGREAFDRSFRQMVQEAFPESLLEPLPSDHPIYRGQPGFPLTSIRYKQPVLDNEPGLAEPRLWGVTPEGRLVIVYSPYALGCGLDGHVCFGCRGLVNEDARRLAANIVLYALTH